MNRREFMKVCVAAAGAGVIGIPAVACDGPWAGSVGLIAGEAIEAGKMVGIGSDGLGYMAFRREVRRIAYERWGLVNPE